MTRRATNRPVNVDADLNNADWPKRRSWDFFGPVPPDEDALAEFVQTVLGMPLVEFKQLPAYQGWLHVTGRDNADQ